METETYSSRLRTEDDPMLIDELIERLNVIASASVGKDPVSESLRLLLDEYERRRPICKLNFGALMKILDANHG